MVFVLERMWWVSPPRGHLHPKVTDSAWVWSQPRGIWEHPTLTYVHVESDLSQQFALSCDKGWRKASRWGLPSTCPGRKDQIVLQELNDLLMVFKHRRWLHLATQLHICISKKRRALPSPEGGLVKLPPVGEGSMHPRCDDLVWIWEGEATCCVHPGLFFSMNANWECRTGILWPSLVR